MAANLQAIESLYQNEIELYKNQIDELRKQNKSKDEKNAALITRVQTLNDLVEKANETNKDLHTAFDHVREQNMKLQAYTGPQESVTTNIEDENEMALENVQRQYINLASDSVSWISDKDKLTQRIKFLERDCDRYARDNLTLGKQVRHLLKALEEERGMIIRRSDFPTRDPSKPISAVDVIDDHLVTFESIAELQAQNQKLLSLVKELSKKEEEKEPEVETVDAQGLNNEITELKNQLESVKSDREKIMNAFNTLLKERDLFKILLCKTRDVEHMTPEIFQRMVSIACSARPAITLEQEATNEKDAQINELKEAMSQVQSALTELREESERTRTEAAQELKLKSDLLEQSHMKILAESQQVETLRERNQMLESNAKALLNEFDEARTKLQKLTFELESKTDLLDQANQKITVESQRVQNLREENQTLESNNKDMMYELDELKVKLQNATYELESTNDSLDQANRRMKSDQKKLETLMEKNAYVESQYSESLTQLEQANLQIQNLTNDLGNKIDESIRLKEEIEEFQHLRNLERSERLETLKRVRVLIKSTRISTRLPTLDSPNFRRIAIKRENPSVVANSPIRVVENSVMQSTPQTKQNAPKIQDRVKLEIPSPFLNAEINPSIITQISFPASAEAQAPNLTQNLNTPLSQSTPIVVDVPSIPHAVMSEPTAPSLPVPNQASVAIAGAAVAVITENEPVAEPTSESSQVRTSEKTGVPPTRGIMLKRRKVTINRN